MLNGFRYYDSWYFLEKEMRKVVKRTLWGVALLLVAVLVIAAIYLVQLFGMSPLKTGKVVDNIYAVKDSFVNLFVVRCESQYVVFDAGNRPDHVRQEFAKLSIEPQKVSHVFLTHSDWDHVKALGIFSNAKIFIAKAEVPMINGETTRFLFQKNRLDLPYQTLDDRQVIQVGHHRIQGILTPGHTPGSMCFLLDDTYLFSGDTLRLQKGRVVHFNRWFNMDTKEQERSLKQLKQITSIKYIFTAHYGYTAAVEKAFTGFK